MLHPLVENLPSYVIREGRKYHTSEQVEFLQNLITKLSDVNSEDLGNAYNKIGIIYVYLNEFDKAVEAFKKSVLNQYSEVAYSNYLVTLDTSGKYNEAIEKGLEFLESNPNNKRIFSVVSEIIYRYPDIDYIESLSNYFKHQFDSEISRWELQETRIQVERKLEVLDSLGIDKSYFNFITNLAFSEVAKIQMGSTNFNSYLNEDIEQLMINVEVFGINKEDISILNKNFDARLNYLINNNSISFNTYINHLMKFNFSFTTNDISQLVA